MLLNKTTPKQYSLEGIDMSSSLGWGHIEFIDSSPNEINNIQNDSILHGDNIENSDHSISRLPTRYLYIQMEFCDATLRAAIDGGFV